MLEPAVNGELRRFDGVLDVARLLERLELAGKKVAVERNGEIVPRSRYGATALATGDWLEIVVAVGGGRPVNAPTQPLADPLVIAARPTRPAS